LIIDCHSYPSQPLKRDLDKNPNRPDFKIGMDVFYTPKYLFDAAGAFLKTQVTWGLIGPIKAQ